jgi:hypothetical protein
MKRSNGVTISSIFVFIGSGVTLIFAAIMIFSSILVGTQEQQPPFIKYAMFAIAVIEIGFASWGVASGVGLLRLREWARISIIAFSGFLLLISIPGLFMMLAIPFPTPPNSGDPELARHMMTAVRIFTSIFYGLLISTAAVWLYFFNTRFVREQFKGVASANVGVGLVGCAGGVALAEAAPTPVHHRPISVSIIAWYLLISSPVVAIFFFIHLPVLILWFLVRGPKATMLLVGMGILQIVMGIGLLKLREWARILAICYFAFVALNSLTMAFVPKAQARFQEAQSEVQSVIGTPATFGTSPTQMHFPVWFGLAFSLPLTAVVVWFLAASKPAFAPPAPHRASTA